MSSTSLLSFIDMDDNFIKCPKCNDSYTHQGKIEIFNRSEDESEGTHVAVRFHEIKIDKNLEGNPSSRRQGVTINMTCESHEHNFKVNIYQHKGQTLVNVVS